MFIINLTYKAELEVIEQLLQKHVAFLDEQYELGNFLASGRKVPRSGGIILSHIKSKDELKKLLPKTLSNKMTSLIMN